MTFDPILADVRFGTGLSPRHPPPARVEEILERLLAPDAAARRFPIPSTAQVTPTEMDLREANKAVRDADGNAARDAARDARADLRAAARSLRENMLAATVARGVYTDDGFRERLVAFWANHFTARSLNTVTRHLVTPFVEQAIRPNVATSLGSMLRAVVREPVMLTYLDQHRSVGPNSPIGVRRERRVDQVVINAGTRPLDELYFELRDGATNRGEVDHAALIDGRPQSVVRNPAGAYQLFRIGDAVAARNTHAAIYDALRLMKAA